GLNWWRLAVRIIRQLRSNASPARRNARILASSTAGIVVLILVLLAVWWKLYSPDRAPAESFEGDSSLLKQTVIVPTLDSPIPDGKSAIWCLSFQLARNEFKTKVAKGPFTIEGAEEIAARLNRAPESEQDIDPELVYANAGLVKDGIQAKIKSDMQQKF